MNDRINNLFPLSFVIEEYVCVLAIGSEALGSDNDSPALWSLLQSERRRVGAELQMQTSVTHKKRQSAKGNILA